MSVSKTSKNSDSYSKLSAKRKNINTWWGNITHKLPYNKYNDIIDDKIQQWIHI